MSRANTAAAKAKRRRQRSAVRLTPYRPEDEELARAWLEADQEEAGGEGWDQWIKDDWDHRWVVMRGDVPVGLAQAAILRGAVTLHDGTHPAAPVCEIGYFTAPDHRGQRIATEVVALLPKQPALQQVQSWLGAVRETNTPSVRVLLRAGFRYAGPSPKAGFTGYIRP